MVVVIALGGLGGAVLGLLARATAGVIGIVAGYAVLVEGFIANGVQGGALQPWLVRLNVDAFVGKGATYFVETCGPDGCQGAQHTLGYTHGWVYLLVLCGRRRRRRAGRLPPPRRRLSGRGSPARRARDEPSVGQHCRVDPAPRHTCAVRRVGGEA